MRQGVRLTLIVGLFNAALLGLSWPAMAQVQDAKGKALADALVGIEGDEDTWGHVGLFAWGIEIGIPEAQMLSAWPGAKIETLSEVVLSTLRKGAQGTQAWIDILDDQRATKVVENDLFGGGSSPNAKKLSVGDLAFSVLASLPPAQQFAADQIPENPKERRDFAVKVCRDWAKQVGELSSADTLARWFKVADDGQRRMLLAIAIQTRFTSAYPLIEADFLARAEKPDDFFYLEVSAYVRHRRKLIQELIGQIKKKLPPPNAEDRNRVFFVHTWDRLTSCQDMDEAIRLWYAEKIPSEMLGLMLVQSIDQPWAFHSMGIEPTAVHRGVLESSLRCLIAAAHSEQNVGKRIQLLEIGHEAAELLNETIGRSNKVDRYPRPKSKSPDWKVMVEQLKNLLDDQRLQVQLSKWEYFLPITPAENAANIVVQIWGEETETEEATDRPRKRWVSEELDPYWGSNHHLVVDAARQALSPPAEGFAASTGPENANLIAQRFGDKNAADWRKSLNAMKWDERLLFARHARLDHEFALRVWSRMIEFVDWQAVSPAAKSESFQEMWKDKLIDRSLDRATWRSLTTWIVDEARGKSFWSIIGESAPSRPGISLYIFESPLNLVAKTKSPELTIRLAGGRSLIFSGPYRYVINADSLEPIADQERGRVGNRDLNDMLKVIEENSGNVEHATAAGFVFNLLIARPKLP